MLKRKYFVAVVAAFTLHSSAFADSASDNLTNLLLSMNTMKANFVQTIKDKSKTLQKTQGIVALQRPGKFRWEVQSPVAQIIIANNSRLWIYDPDLEQVTVRKFSKAAGQTPALLLSDKNLTLGNDFNVTVLPATSQIANQQIFELTPKNKNDAFERIKLTFISKQIRQMQLEDRLGHQTVISFQNVKTGIALPASLFNFTPPPRVDVIDETKNKT